MTTRLLFCPFSSLYFFVNINQALSVIQHCKVHQPQLNLEPNNIFMGLLFVNYLWMTSHASTTHPLCPSSSSICAKFIGLRNGAKSHNAFKFSIRAFASRKAVKKLEREERLTNETNDLANRFSSEDEFVKDGSQVSSVAPQNLTNVPSRNNVLQACTVTCGLMAALGVIIRQVSHVASVEGLPIHDCSTEGSFGFEMSHLELITGLVILISLCRYLLLKAWPDFAESSEAANQQVLTSLEPVDYLVVAFLPGVSEELLFRGALLPLFGTNWTSILVVATIFGVLHLGSGRKYSFAVWATFVGILYGYSTIVSNSIIVPMASHSLNNLVGGILWRYTSKTSK